MEEDKDTALIVDEEASDDENSSLGTPEYEFSPQQETKWSEVATLESNSDEATPEKVDKEKENTYVTDGKINSPVGAKKKSTSRIGPRCMKTCEALMLTLVIVIIVGAFTIPTVLYALPSAEDEFIFINKTDSACLEVALYTGEVCRDVFPVLQTCFSGVSSPPPPSNFPSGVDQVAGEANAVRLVNGLSLLNPTPQCSEAIIPFLCLSIFKLCDANGGVHNIISEDCHFLRDEVCAEEWSQAVGLLGDGILPVCEGLPDINDDCIEGNSSRPTSISNTMNTSDTNGTMETSNTMNTSFHTTPSPNSSSGGLVCSEGFFFDENITNLCRPICGVFNPIALGLVSFQRSTIAVSLLASIAMFVMALTIQRKTLLVFPSILFVYMCISTFFLSLVVVMGFFDNTALFCGSRDFVTATQEGNETPFCTISGLTFNYCLEQIFVWAMLHAFFVFWGVVFPFSYRQFKLHNRVRYAHVISITIAVVIPLVSLIHLRDGYVNSSTPTYACVGRNVDFTFYATILPTSVLVCITSILLMLILWIILKEFVIKKLLARQKIGNIAKAQLKITAIVIYYTVLGISGLASYTYYDIGESYQRRIANFVLCESSGVSDCEINELGPVAIFLSTLVLTMISFLPVVTIVFSFDPKAYKKKAKPRDRTFTRSTTANSQIFSRANTGTSRSDVFARSNSAAFHDYRKSSTATSKMFARSNTATSKF